MKSGRTLIRVAVAALSFLCCVAGTIVAGNIAVGELWGGPQSGHAEGVWLDAAIANWNRPGARLPKTKTLATEAFERCKDAVRKPATPEERAVAAAGWVLFGESQAASDTVAVQGETSVDGMCRPLAYQVFVFAKGKFAGTISPYPMSARQDGASQSFRLVSPDTFEIKFSRYADADARCCPSMVTSVSYHIEDVQGQPVLTASPPTTTPTTTPTVPN